MTRLSLNHLKDTSKVFWPALALILVLAAYSQANAQDSNISEPGEDFSTGNAGAAPNQDSDVVPGLSVGSPSYAGTGCPQGSVSVAVSPDQRVLSMIFDSHILEVGGQSGVKKARSTCNLKIPFQVPAGYRVQIVKLDYRGFVSVPSGAQAVIAAGFGYSGVGGKKINVKARRYKGMFKGPSEQDFMLSTLIRGPEWTPCGESFVLETESVINMKANPHAEAAISTIDSMDAAQNPVRVALRWKKCEGGDQPGRPDRPGRGNRPDRPGRPFQN